MQQNTDAGERASIPVVGVEGCAITMKTACLLLCLCVFSRAICAEQTDACAGLEGAALSQCRSNQQTLERQERLEQQLQAQQERQNQLDKQEREVQQQLESMRQQNESLRHELERETANQSAHPAATDRAATERAAAAKSQDLKNWKADNSWYGSDYARTQFATHYMKQLEKERPDLTGRELLDAVSTKVNETFGARH
jgi:TolA-binding protein